MRLIDADALLQEFADRAKAARRWKENALKNGDEKLAIRATATLDFLTEVKLSIEAAPTAVDLPELKEAYQDGYKDGQNDIQEKLVIIRAKIMLDKVELQYFRDKFKKEYEEGLIVLPEYFEVTVHDVIRDVKIEGGEKNEGL